MSNVTSRTISSFTAAANELHAHLVKLYKCKTFIRLGKELWSEMMSVGLQACAEISAVDGLVERNAKISAVHAAVVGCNRLQYIISTMHMLALYTSAEIKEIVPYLAKLIAALTEVLTRVPATQKKIKVAVPAAPDYQSAAVSAAAVADGVAKAQADRLPAKTVIDIDDGGFNDPVEAIAFKDL